MSSAHVVPLQNGEHVVDVFGQIDGYHVLTFVYGTLPTAGKIAVFARYLGLGWAPVNEAATLDMTSTKTAVAVGPVDAYRFVISGLVDGADLTVHVTDLAEWPGPGMPAGLFEGTRAITVQPYTEANVKNGVQFNLRAVWPIGDVIPSLASRKIWVKTNAKTVLVKLRELQYLAEELKIELFRAPTGVTGGTDLSIHNYNGVSPVATTVQAKKNVTIANNGVQFDNGDPEYFFGSSNAPQRQTSSIPQGRERVLPANTEFAVVITNTGTGDARVQYFLDWYEGGTDLPVN